MKFTLKQLAIPVAAVVAFVGGAAATVASAAANDSSARAGRGTPPGVVGTVASVSGNTITLTGKDGKTYTVDASAATIEKTETVTVANVAAGDTLMVGGTVSGTSVAATHIMDGKMPEGGFGGLRGEHGKGPGVFGTVSAVSGTTLTLTGKDGTTYTVDAASAKVLKAASGEKPTESTVSAIATGDTVMIHGTISGASVTAEEIIDGAFMQGPHAGTPRNTTTSN